MTCDILIHDIKGLVQVRDGNTGLVCGQDMSVLPVIENAWLAIEGEQISGYGNMAELPSMKAERRIDASGRFVFPSFVDSHTHLVYANSREEEFVMKIRGMSYQEIAARGGGILNSAAKVRAASEEELFERTLTRVDEIISTGTGAVEIKSGYGLTTADELKMLRVARRIGRDTPLPVRTTFLGAHAVPQGTTRELYVRSVIEEMIPAVAGENLADYIDVFCEEGFFTVQETEAILTAGLQYGLKGRVHANQLSNSGAVQVAVQCGALTVDHLESIGESEIQVLRKGRTIPTVLPGAAFFLRLPYPPARRMIDAGLPLVVASDYNPGSAPTGNMSLMVALACIGMRLSPEEALNAVTLNAAAALEWTDALGSITRGKLANILITRPMPSIAYLAYAWGSSLIETVILRGKVQQHRGSV